MGKMSKIHQEHRDDCYIALLPFLHQIGGHHIVLQYDDSTICKELNNQERQFYETSPQDLREFLPKYKGTVEVNIQEDEHGVKRFLARHQNRGSENDDSDFDHGAAITRRHSDVINYNDVNNNEENVNVNSPDNSGRNASAKSAHSNPIVKKLQNRFYDKIKQSQTRNFRFLLLENIVAKYEHPCILDIKMGTQQHGDDASEEKKRIQMLKCQNSTSSVIGSRLCGMQVFQVSSYKYVHYDKYTGRTLNVDGFRGKLLQFIHNGLKYRIDVIDPIIEKLKNLHEVVKSKGSYRFYGSSLLILYDGKEPYMSSSPSSEVLDTPDSVKVDVRMIDFAHSTHADYNNHKPHSGPDNGYLFGLENLIKIFNDIKKDCLNRMQQEDYSSNNDTNDTSYSIEADESCDGIDACKGANN